MTKRSITIDGHRTSVSIEEPFWTALTEIANTRKTSAAALVGEIDHERPQRLNLSAAIRIYVLNWYRQGSNL